jgi:hypothetical protein
VDSPRFRTTSLVGWTVEQVQATAPFIRLRVIGDDELIVDLAIDSPPGRARTVGNRSDVRSRGARRQKLAALFGRAEARDFVDVYVLAQRSGHALLLERAAEVDLGFSADVLSEMMGTLDRSTTTSFPSTLPTSLPSARTLLHGRRNCEVRPSDCRERRRSS